MSTMQKEEYMTLGMMYAREGNLEAAFKNLSKAFIKYTGLEHPGAKMEKEILTAVPLELLSYYGLCSALVRNRVEEGINLCKRVLARDPLNPAFYLNLGRVYLKGNQKAEAVKVFLKGLDLGDKNSDIIRQLKKLGIRKKRPLSFLPRNHFLNRYTGLFLHKLQGQRAGLR